MLCCVLRDHALARAAHRDFAGCATGSLLVRSCCDSAADLLAQPRDVTWADSNSLHCSLLVPQFEFDLFERAAPCLGNKNCAQDEPENADRAIHQEGPACSECLVQVGERIGEQE